MNLLVTLVFKQKCICWWLNNPRLVVVEQEHKEAQYLLVVSVVGLGLFMGRKTWKPASLIVVAF